MRFSKLKLYTVRDHNSRKPWIDLPSSKVNIYPLLILAGTICMNWPGFAQQDLTQKVGLDRLEIEGNREFSRRQFQDWFRLKPGDRITEAEVSQRGQQVLQRLSEEGFFFARIDSILLNYKQDSTQVHVVVHLDEGALLKVGEIFIAGLHEEHAKIVDELQSRSGDRFSPMLLQEDIDSIIRHFENNGYPYCKVRVKKLGMRSPSAGLERELDVDLEVLPGPQVSIAGIEIRGKQQTKDYVIVRELEIKPGAAYDQRQVDRIQSTLLRLGYFKWVNPPKLVLQGANRGNLVIELSEGNNNRFDGVVGYNPATGNSPGFVTGLIDIAFRNLLGTGRQVEVHWERRTARTQQMRFQYVEPWVAGLPLNLGVGFEQLIRDTSYVERQFGIDARLLFNRDLTIFARMARQSVSPDSLGAALFAIPTSRALNFGFGATLNTLDFPQNPRSGVLYQTSFELRRKDVEALESKTTGAAMSGSFDQRILAVDFETYLAPFRWQVVLLGLHGRRITSDEPEITITDQFRFGGTRNLRGYREEQFRGSRIAWANLEYRYLLNRNSRAFAFLDTGYFFREESLDGTTRSLEDAKIGYGIGLRLDTKIGFFGIDYGLGEGDGLSNGKVHISLKNEF